MRKLSLSQTPVYCLHIRKYRETSAIISCFSKDHGRIDFVGKGLYRSKTKNDLPEYFQEYRLSGICRSELGTLTELELIHVNSKLVGQAWLTACYSNELLLKFLPRLEAIPELYIAYQNLLDNLHMNEDYQQSLLWFEKRLLDSLGYGINFLYEAQNDAVIEAQEWYQFSVNSGFRICSDKGHQAIPGFVIQAMAEEKFRQSDNQYFNLAKRVIRSALKYQLGDIALRTVSVSNDLKQFTQA